jgi:hypothetical protein
MDLGKMFSATLKISALVAVVWGAIGGIIGLIPGINVLALLVTVPLGFLIPVVLGFFAVKQFAGGSPLPLANGAVSGAISGVTYGLVVGIVGLVFQIIGMFTGLGFGAAMGGAEGAAAAGTLGLISLAVSVIVGLPIIIILSAILALVGGALYSIIQK